MTGSLGQLDLSKLPRTERERVAKLLTPKTTKYIVHKPYPKQMAFMLLPGKEAFYGGAAGGGKSDALLMCALQYVDIPGYNAILFRKTFADLVKPGALIDRAKEWLAPWTVTKEIHWVEKERKFVFPSGAILQFGYMETDNDRFNYQGGEYQFIGFDEVTHMSEVCYKYLFSRLRKLRGVDIPLRIRAASNPPDDGDDAEWVYNRFVNPETKRPHVVFIPAGMNDNPFLDTETYVENLEELDAVTRARLRDGNWEITRKGNMFKEEWFEYVEPSEVPKHRRIVRSWDMASTREGEVTASGKKKKPDSTASVKLSEADGIYYIEDIVGVKDRPGITNELQKITAQMDGKQVPIVEEQEPGSSGDYTIDTKAKSIFLGYAYKGVRSSGSKVTRAMPVSTAAERKRIKIVKGCRNVKPLMDELMGFPAFPHDDYVDALSLAFSQLALAPKVTAPVSVGNVVSGSYWSPSAFAPSERSYEDSVGSYWHSI